MAIDFVGEAKEESAENEFEERLEAHEEEGVLYRPAFESSRTECAKCGFNATSYEKDGKLLCDFCAFFAPKELSEFRQYVSEEASWKQTRLYRKYLPKKGLPQKEGMQKKAQKGEVMSRAPFGYRWENKRLVPADHAREVEDIFEEFLNETISLNKLAKRHGFSVNGLKKILTNFTYVGKVRFDGEIHEGHHKPLVSSTTFNHVQNKLERRGIKKI